MNEKITPYQSATVTKKEQVATMFNNISGTYDFLNHFLSAGIDIIWRKKAIRELSALKPKVMLDVATGTGDFAFEAIKILAPEKIIGVDISVGMLDVARKKIAERNLQHVFSVQTGDSEGLKFEDNHFDAITVAFGVRNYENLEKGLSDMLRVLKPGGKIVILEFSKPTAFPVKQSYNFYFKHLLPVFGKLFSKDARAYTYLNESVIAFPDGKSFTQLMDKVGYTDTRHRSLTFGISAIYTGIKA
ncbi:bifunctional demethylmenaquinone methyltransferase/2-methoxy-6-polyprenyl-1,4-benzoquinol methylase UbiE [Pedobacter sp. MC2016-15]|jgi:demethylmenaquinone methyltransferase/2-methoxy-6-polyprenyl-1,4-benzoquinol methylase|uniref:bifunctional demethylmenaquinone methyltransferase/2-methoxy-6-polyprenyl-1,4-benzoquinol methylase UbiE n=1 Tax=Pedobacter sp. MC2016-15 TaxID=2994473 RepID=UPI002247FF13|nr:bifunctional demethylmenaquinone methyltransferase/2-methoxy-6-polyprenyl-1,4-benzoquinol methylase UbiE [Pedobacter sp. MC2016-15]MCX2479168.1 bifunctional demethylmenaquinone methyltransferase/2-methoxy-6-polyprenyl-1,4-benzoquinol methylase UbiE [Pedobacter sp. MC2016-15]